ncbi:hypothetical protein GCM10007913_43050 [Devosia yakushimensis]|uniref:Uncharacterized protein n=1 Tax=Devosia yakushimensis TaxID=470028 RepID=A0ABQ5ULY9_9HYPH|nr:hypothetical protein GCM10007913_43050 [Devosia yakushimensis]
MGGAIAQDYMFGRIKQRTAIYRLTSAHDLPLKHLPFKTLPSFQTVWTDIYGALSYNNGIRA